VIRRRSGRLFTLGRLAAVGAGVAVLVVGLGALPGETKASAGGTKIAAAVLQSTANGRKASFVIYLRQQADLSAAYDIQDPDARGWYVYDRLKELAARSQASIRGLLARAGTSSRSLWIANAIIAEGGRPLVDALAARQDVGAIEPDAPSSWLHDGASRGARASPTAPTVVEPGVAYVHAPQLWALGFTGQGIVVADQDTGVRWTHAGLIRSYRGWNGATADHDFNWFDAIHTSVGNPCGNDSPSPCDDSGHGTHTTGTMVGEDNGGANQVGVAPGAKWIACRSMDQGNGSPQTYSECFQFFLAPTDLNGQNADPTKRPDVMNNSWGCTPSESCAANTLKTIVKNTEAAGIFVVASAGNEGPGCSTVDNPPAIYASSFAAGAVNAGTDELAGFSSRGPVTVDGSGRIKPDVVAPGVNVR